MAIRVEVVGTLDDAGEQGTLCGVELTEILAEVRLGGLAEAVDGEGAALTEVDLIGVHLKDLLLAEARLQLERDEDLDQLALDVADGRQEDAARELHRQGGAAAGVAAIALKVVIHPAEHRVVVNAAMLKKAAVLDGGYGLHHARRDLVVGDQAPFGAVLVFGKRCDELRLELVGAERGAVVGGDALNVAAGGVDRCAIRRVEGLRAGLDDDGVAVAVKCPELVIAVVARLGELAGDLVGGKVLTVPDLRRCSVDLRDGSEEWTGGQALVDDLLVLVVVEGHDRGGDEDDRENKDGEGTEERIGEDAAGLLCAAAVFDFDGQGLSFFWTLKRTWWRSVYGWRAGCRGRRRRRRRRCPRSRCGGGRQARPYPRRASCRR